MDDLWLLGDGGPREDGVAVDRATIGQVTDAVAGASMGGIVLERCQPLAQRRHDITLDSGYQTRTLLLLEASVDEHDR